MMKIEEIAFTPEDDCFSAHNKMALILAEENPMYYMAFNESIAFNLESKDDFGEFVFTIGFIKKEWYDLVMKSKEKITDIFTRYCRNNFRFTVVFVNLEAVDHMFVNWDCKERTSKEI